MSCWLWECGNVKSRPTPKTLCHHVSRFDIQEYEVRQEEEVYDSADGKRKPDIAASKDNRTIILDAQVVSKQTYLNRAVRTQKEYYVENSSVLNNINRSRQPDEISAKSITFSWIGVWRVSRLTVMNDLLRPMTLKLYRRGSS